MQNSEQLRAEIHVKTKSTHSKGSPSGVMVGAPALITALEFWIIRSGRSLFDSGLGCLYLSTEFIFLAFSCLQFYLHLSAVSATDPTIEVVEVTRLCKTTAATWVQGEQLREIVASQSTWCSAKRVPVAQRLAHLHQLGCGNDLHV